MVRFTGRASKPDCTANASVQLDTILAHARRLHRRCTVEGSQLVLHKSLRTQRARDYARNRASVLRKRARHGEVAMPRQNVMRLDRSGAYFQFLHPEHVMIR